MNFSVINKNIQSVRRAALLTLIPLILITLYFLFIYKSFNENVLVAEELYKNWEIDECIELCKSLINEESNNLHLQNLYGKALLATGDLHKARSVFHNLIINDSLNKSSHKFNLAFTHFYLGNLDSSSLMIDEIMPNHKPGKNQLLYSQCMNLLGLIAFNRAEYKTALHYQKESLKIARQVGSLKAEADALRQIGVLSWYNGKIDSVIIKYYDPALSLYRISGDKKGEATVISNIGHIFWTQGNWLEKTKHQLEAMSIRKKINDRIGIADSYYFLAHSIPYSGKGRSFAYSYYKKSFEISSKIGYAWGKEVALRGLIDIQNSAVDFELPGIQLDTSIISSTEGKIYFVWSKAKKYVEEGDLFSAEKEYRKGINLCDSLGIISGIEYPLLKYADILISIGEYDEAQKKIERAMRLTSSIPRPHGYSESKFRLANLLFFKGKMKESARLFKQLAQFYDSVYTDYLNSVNPSFAFETASGKVHLMRSKVYSSYIRNLLSLNRYDEAFESVEKERLLPFWVERESESANGIINGNNLASELITLIEESDKNDFESISKAKTKLGEIYQKMITGKDDSLLSFQIPVKDREMYNKSNFTAGEFYNLNDVINILNPAEVLLEYFVDEDKIYVFVLRNSGLIVIDLEIRTNDLASIVEIFNETILMGKESSENNLWKKPSSYLFSLLIEPLKYKNLIKPEDHLFISPHKLIHFIPFQALLSESGNFLIEDHSLTYLPSSNYLVKKRSELNLNLKNAIAIAPDYNSLPFSKNEINEISNHNFLSLKKLIESDAKVTEFLKEAGNFDLIHIAAHGKINRKYPLYSYMEFADRRIKLHEILKLKLKSSLVFLSSCETGISLGESGLFPSGHDIVSFPRAFITAGSASVISPMWVVEDESTSELVKHFYKHLSLIGFLQTDVFLSKILSIAQRKLIELFRKSGKEKSSFLLGRVFYFR